MYLKLGDENILRHLMCLKNRRQMKFWWETEWDYGDAKKSSPNIYFSDEKYIWSLNVVTKKYVVTQCVWKINIVNPKG